MPKYIQAYFKSEDQAEGARSNLLPLQLEHLEVGKLDSEMGGTSNHSNPVFPINTATTNAENVIAVSGYTGVRTSFGIIPIVSSSALNDKRGSEEDFESTLNDPSSVSDADYSRFQYVLSAKVKDSEYEDIVHKLKNKGAFIEHVE